MAAEATHLLPSGDVLQTRDEQRRPAVAGHVGIGGHRAPVGPRDAGGTGRGHCHPQPQRVRARRVGRRDEPHVRRRATTGPAVATRSVARSSTRRPFGGRRVVGRGIHLDRGGRQRDVGHGGRVGHVCRFPSERLHRGPSDLNRRDPDHSGHLPVRSGAREDIGLVGHRRAQPVDQAGVDLPAVARPAHRERGRDRGHGAVEEQSVTETTRLDRVQLRALLVRGPLDA